MTDVYFEWSDDGRWFLRGTDGRFKSQWFKSFDELMEFYMTV